MAARDDTFKAFVLKKKTEYRLRFPFLKENQVVAKLKKIWQSKRALQPVPELAQKKGGKLGGDVKEPKTEKPRKSPTTGLLHELDVPKCSEVNACSKHLVTKGCPLSELTPNTPFRVHCPVWSSATPPPGSLWDAPADSSPDSVVQQSGSGDGWVHDHPGVEAQSGNKPADDCSKSLLSGQPCEGSLAEPAYGTSPKHGNATDPNSMSAEAGVDSGLSGIEALSGTSHVVTVHSCDERQEQKAVPHSREKGTHPLPPLSRDATCGTPPLPVPSRDAIRRSPPSLLLMSCDFEEVRAPPPPVVMSHDSKHAVQHPSQVNEQAGQQQQSQKSPRPSRRSRVCRDWRRSDAAVDIAGLQPLGEGSMDTAVTVEGIATKEAWGPEATAQLSLDKGSGSLSQTVVCEMFVPLLPLDQHEEGSLHRRVFRSAAQESQSNFSTMFSNDSEIFL